LALAMLGDEEAARILIARIETENSEYSRGAAALALGYLVPPERAGVLVTILSDGKNSDATRTLAAIAIGRVVEKSKVPILSLFSDHLDPALPEGAVKEALRIM
jgi:HEAT repeat protein